MASDEQRLVIALEARLNKYEKDMQRAIGTNSGSFRQMERRAKQAGERIENAMTGPLSRINNAMAAMRGGFAGGLLGGLAGGVSLQGFQSLLEGAGRVTASLKQAGLAGADLDKVYGELYASAQRNAQPIEDLTKFYGELTASQKELGTTQQGLLQFTDNVALAAKASGLSASDAASAFESLTTSLRWGKVEVGDYDRLLSQMRPLVQAAANGIQQAGGSVEKLTQLVKDGKISGVTFFDAINAGSDEMRASVDQSSQTVSEGMVRVKNALTDAARKFDESSEATKTFGSALDDVATSISSFDVTHALGEFNRFIKGAGDARDAIVGFGQSLGAWLGTDRIGANIIHAAPWLRRFGVRSTIDDRIAQNEPSSGETRPPLEVPVKPNKIDITKSKYAVKDSGSGGGDSESEDEYERMTRRIAERTKTVTAMTAAQAGINPLINDYGFAMDKAKAAQDLLNSAEKAGLEITPELRANIDALASKYATATSEAKKLAKSQDEIRQAADNMKNLGKDVLGGFISDLRSGKSAAEAMANALNKVLDKMLDMALNSLFGLPGGLGGLGKIFGFSSGGAVGDTGTGGSFAAGGYTGAGGKYQPAGIVHAGEYVMDASTVRRAGGPAAFDALRAALKGYADGGYVGNAPAIRRPVLSAASAPPVQQFAITSSVTVNATGGEPAQNADLAARVGKQVEGQIKGMIQDQIRQAARPGNFLNSRNR